MSIGVPTPPRTPPESPDFEHPGGPVRAGVAAQRPRRSAARAQSERWAPSPQFTRTSSCQWSSPAIALALITSWPLVLHMSSRIAPDLGDPVRTAWQIAWVGHAMLHDPLHIFNSNAFYPHPLSLAFSDSLLGYGPTAFFGSGTVAALVRYNLLFLFAWSLCFVGAYLLARELGLGRLGGRRSRRGLRVCALPGHRGRPPARDLLGRHPARAVPAAAGLPPGFTRAGARGWLVSAWQVSLGFTLGLQYTYLLARLGAAVLAYWWWRGHSELPARTLPPAPASRAHESGPAATGESAHARS